MLPFIYFSLGIVFSVSFSLLLIYMVARRNAWTNLMEQEEALWVKLGVPATWAARLKKIEQGTGFKVCVALCILNAMVLTTKSLNVILLTSDSVPVETNGASLAFVQNIVQHFGMLF